MSSVEERQVDDYVWGGYYICRRGPAPCSRDAPSDLLPEKVVSASTCICKMIPSFWAIKWASCKRRERRATGAEFGIPREELRRVIRWVTEALAKAQIGWPDVIYSLETARELAGQFLHDTTDIVLFGLGLPRKYMSEFVEHSRPHGRHEFPCGLHEAVKKGFDLAPHGQVLGHEVLGFDGCGFCSWLCDELETDVAREFGIKPNSYGLIETSEEAEKVAEYYSREEVPSEPLWWLPWIVVQYRFTPS